MTNLLQVLSEKAKETREQFARNVQTTGYPKIDQLGQLGRPSEPRSHSPVAEQELQQILPKKPDTVPERLAPAPQEPSATLKLEEGVQQHLPSHLRLALLATAVACLLYAHLRPVLRWLSSGSGLLDIIAVSCIVAAAPAIPRTQVQQTIQAVKLQIMSAGVAVKALPQMSTEMSAMLEEIRAMRRDVGGMAKKAAWLPGS